MRMCAYSGPGLRFHEPKNIVLQTEGLRPGGGQRHSGASESIAVARQIRGEDEEAGDPRRAHGSAVPLQRRGVFYDRRGVADWTLGSNTRGSGLDVPRNMYMRPQQLTRGRISLPGAASAAA